MNTKTLFKLGILLLALSMLISVGALAQVKYLNSTDGDDSYTGDNPTNSPAGTGPKRTVEGAFAAFATGTTVTMAAGVYNFDQSGIGGGNDADGYQLTLSKSMTFVVQTYNANNVVTLNGGPMLVNIGAANTVTFTAASAGVQSVSFAPGAPANFTLQSGTLNISGLGASGFTLGANVGTGGAQIIRTDGSIVGVPAFAVTGTQTVVYNGVNSKTAGGEIPSSVLNLILAQTVAGTTVTFPNAITFPATGGGLTAGPATTTNAIFNGLVTLTTATIAPTATINNSVAATWTFNAGVTVRTRQTANGSPIVNTGTGTVAITGPLSITQATNAPANDAAHTSSVDNTAGGTLTLSGGVSETATGVITGVYVATRTPVLSVLNASGTLNLGAAAQSTTVNGTFVGTTGTANVNGPVTIAGAITNAATHTIGIGSNTLTVSGAGPHTNTGNITSSAIGVGLVDFTGAAVVTGAGSLPNVRSGGSAVGLNGVLTINGNMTSAGAGLLSSTSVTTVTGSINSSSSGGITITSATTTVQNSISLTGSGTVTTNLMSVTNDVTVNAGNLVLGGNLTVGRNLLQTGGSIDLVTFILDMKGNFARNAGTFVYTAGVSTGTLQFSSGGTQVFSGGTNIRVYNFAVTSVGTGVTFVTGSLEVANNATIVANTNVQLGTLNIRMLGLAVPPGPGLNTFTNAGQYTSTGGGGVIFEGPDVGGIGTPGSIQFIGGNGVYSNIEIRLADEVDYVDVVEGQTVTFSGELTLTRGTVRVGNGAGAPEVLNPSTLITTPTIRRNLGDITPVPGGDLLPDGRPILIGGGGTFNASGVAYHVEYFGTLTANQSVGTEFIPGVIPRTVDLTIAASGGGFRVQLTNAEYRFSGNLTILQNAILEMLGAGNFNLVSAGVGVTHSIAGTLMRSNTGTFLVTDSAAVVGGTATADQSLVYDMTVTTTRTVAISNLKGIGITAAGGLTITNGPVTLGMQQITGVPQPIQRYAQSGGAVSLTNHIAIPLTYTATGGTFDFKDFNVWMNVAAGSFTAAPPAAFSATGVVNNGYLQYRASGTLNTGGVLVPRIVIDPAAAGVYTVTLTGNSGVNQVFTNTGNDVLALGTFTFEMGGTNTTWNSTGTYTGTTGTILVTGNVTFNMSGNITVPNLTLNNPTYTFTLVDNDGVAGAPSLTVSTLFTMTAGTINQAASDIILANPGLALVYDGGAFTQGVAGRVIFNAILGYNVNATGLVIPRLTVSANSTLGAAPSNKVFTVQSALVFGAGTLTFGADSTMQLGDGCQVTRLGTGTLSHFPKPLGVIDMFYTTVSNTVAKEMPSAANVIRDLTINPGGGNTITAVRAITINRVLYLTSGTYDATATNYAVAMAAGTTVNRSNGVLTNVSISGGPITLTYSNSNAIATTSNEFPRAVTVTVLNVQGSNTLTLDSSRAAGSFVLNVNAAGTLFDINGLTLSVTDTATATLTRGTLISQKVTAGVYVFGTLNVTGNITSTANTTVTNVNVNAKTASLAGLFNTVDLDGVGPNVLPALPAIATITRDATFAAFTGNAIVGGNATTNGAFIGDLAVTGNATINGNFTGNLTVVGNTSLSGIYGFGSTLTAGGNVTVNAPGGGFAGGENVVFNGTANQTFNLNNGNEAFNTLTLNKTGQTPSGTVTIATTGAQPVTVTLNQINLFDGVLVTGSTNNILLGNVVQGFVRNVAAGKVSHVFGNVTKTAVFAQYGRFEYPVGSMTEYRPAAITFTPANPLVTTTNLTVRHIPLSPGGTAGFPITFPPDIVVDSTAAFSWLITASIGLGPSQIYDLEFQGTGFTSYTNVENIRVVRRLDGSVLNTWNPQGGTYTNFETGTPPALIPIVRMIGSQGGLVPQASHFSFGLKKVVPPTVAVSGAVKYNNTAGSPIAGATVTLNPGGRTTVTDASGNYSFTGVSAGAYTLTASKVGGWPAGAVNATDAFTLVRAQVQIVTLDSLSKLAADVNNNGTFNSTDALLIVQRYAGITSSFAKGDWVFLGASVTIGASPVTANLTGQAVGDVNRSYTPGPSKSASGSLSLNSSGFQKVSNTQAFDIPVVTMSDLALGAVSLKLNYPTDIVKFEGVTASKLDGVVSSEENGTITLAWADMSAGKNPAQFKSNEAIATLRFSPKVKEGSVSVTLDAASEFASPNGVVISSATIASPVAKLSALPTVFALEQNYPNPFNPSTQIEYSLPKSGKVTLTIYSIMGQEVAKLVDGIQEAGVYKVQWNASNLASGMYIYRISVDSENGNFTASKRLMLLK